MTTLFCHCPISNTIRTGAGDLVASYMLGHWVIDPDPAVLLDMVVYATTVLYNNPQIKWSKQANTGASFISKLSHYRGMTAGRA
jgi:hypothetical protein